MNELYDGLSPDSYWGEDLSNLYPITNHDLEKEFDSFDDILWQQNNHPKILNNNSKNTKESKKINLETNINEYTCIDISNRPKVSRKASVDFKNSKRTNGKKDDTKLRIRSRFGCEECKKRRIKCDEAKPLCVRCRAKRIQCKYKILLHFREDYESKGKKFGREGVWKKTGLSQDTSKKLIASSKDAHYLEIHNTNALSFVNFTVDDIFQGKLWIPHSVQLSIIPVDVRNTIDNNLTGFALAYYIDIISPIFNPIGFKGFKNKYTIRIASRSLFFEQGLNLNWLLQYSQSNNSIFYLVIALGFIYLSKNSLRTLDNKDTQTNWLASSRFFKNKGMQIVRETMFHFEAARDKENIHFTTEFLLTLVLSMLYEMADDCNEKWSLYLKMCRSVIFSECFVQPTNDIEENLLQFSLELLNYQETMGRTACKDKNSFFPLYGNNDEEEHVPTLYAPCLRISWMGCNKSLVNVISDITDLSFERFNNICLEKYTTLTNELKNRLIIMDLGINISDYYLEGSSVGFSDSLSLDKVRVACPTLDVEDFCFVLVYEVKRLVCLIYLESCLLNAKPEDHYIETMVLKTYKILKFIIIQNDFKWISTFLWSIFILGAEISVNSSECENLRYLTLQMLDKIQPKSLGNVDMIREIILKIWKSRDIQNCNENSFGDMKNHITRNEINPILGSQNDWEIYVANESYKVSLA